MVRPFSQTKKASLQMKEVQLTEKSKECTEENFAVKIGKKIKVVLKLDKLIPSIIHSLVEQITCTTMAVSICNC